MEADATSADKASFSRAAGKIHRDFDEAAVCISLSLYGIHSAEGKLRLQDTFRIDREEAASSRPSTVMGRGGYPLAEPQEKSVFQAKRLEFAEKTLSDVNEESEDDPRRR